MKSSHVREKSLPTANPLFWRWTIILSLFGLAVVYRGLSRCHHTSFDSESWAISLLGDRPSGKHAQEEFLKVPNEASALAASRHYSAKPHIAGSEQDFQTAKDLLSHIRAEFDIPLSDAIFDAGSLESREATLSIANRTEPYAWIDTYYPLLNLPLNRSLEILDENGTAIWSADLSEQVDDDTDPEAYAYGDAIPTFHGLSKGGSAQGPLVYANLGRKQDYEALVSSGVDFKGKVVIVRYGGIFRGLKVKFAQELGAVAVLIYSDPRDDGSVTVANGYSPYPKGPARNPHSVQRGSVQFLSMYPGDPTTPGYPSYPNATRVDGTNIPTIPSLPISWANAERLLEEIGGGKGTIRVVNRVDDKITPIWNTMAVIPGHIKDEVVILGNHRDAWVLGAADPSSGTVSLYEVIRGYGSLFRKGWRPLRTVVFASWDGEEYGLIGSTEYGEDFSSWIKAHVVAYLNLDTSVSGSRFHALASPSLADLVRNTAKSLAHPTDPTRSLWDAREDVGPYHGNTTAEAKQLYEEATRVSLDTGVGALGSGSDYTVFLQRLGVASVDLGFGSTLSDAVYHYHSVYDSQRWQETYADRGFYKHVTIAKHIGLLGLQISDSITLPINITRYSFELEGYVDKVASIVGQFHYKVNLATLLKSVSLLQSNANLFEGRRLRVEKEFLKLLEELRRLFRTDAEENESMFAFHSVRPSREKLERFRKVAGKIRIINKKLAAFEEGFISSEGIKDREWYKHLVVAPGKNLGYGATTLPALTEALTLDKNATLAQSEAKRLETLIGDLNKMLTL